MGPVVCFISNGLGWVGVVQRQGRTRTRGPSIVSAILLPQRAQGAGTNGVGYLTMCIPGCVRYTEVMIL